FCEALRAEVKSNKTISIHASFPVPWDPLVSSKKRVEMVVQEIWALTGFRFTVWDHRQLKSGHRTRFFCCQDERRKKKSKRSQDPNVRNRDTVGMKRFPCGSKLSISCRTHPTEHEQLTVTVQMEHSAHIPYLDVSMPQEALDMINANVEWLTLVAMVQRVQAAFPVVSAAQIHTAWRELSQGFWRRDDKQLPSTEKLLREYPDDVDVFEPEDVPDGVEMVCWGMKRIAEPLKGKIVEVGVDATYNTNSKHLELYSIMAEQSAPQPTALPAAGNENSDGQEKTTRTFCPARYRDSILTMLEKHYCAHPLLPGYAHPSSEGIRRWAVMQMYKFCFEHGLREVWAYLWENWYRPSRWKLWARSVHEQIPVLKTTMILENQ
ncbi:hypothetical protein B0H14DRAFT_2364226, partial [Mycena olivaceomarginata]